jgi:hypothetical protein
MKNTPLTPITPVYIYFGVVEPQKGFKRGIRDCCPSTLNSVQAQPRMTVKSKEFTRE